MTDTPLSSNQLATERTDMAFGRTVMALERTLMAWIRTSVSLIGFGFTIFKFLEALQSKGITGIREHAPRNLGIFLILLGMLTLLFAIVQFKGAMKKVAVYSEMKPGVSISFYGAIGVLLVGLFTLMNIIFGIGGF